MNITKVSPEFATDLIALINSCKGITYNAKVSYGNTKFEYVTLDKIYAHVKNDPNFAILEPLGTNESGQPALQVIIVHKSGEAITSDYYVLRIAENAKKQDEGAAITYTKRYALGSFLGLCTDEDNDANPEGKGMDGKTPETRKPTPKQRTPREQLIARLHELGIDVNAYAKDKGLTNQTTPERFAELLAELNDGTV